MDAEYSAEHFDVLIIGAGLSGIDAAYHLQKLCPKKSYVILEQRERIGGTWDLFRYPGIRSDSDMLTMSYSFRPWQGLKAISPGADIREYIVATARESGIDRHIRFRHEIANASWSSENACWQVRARHQTSSGEELVTITCNFLFSCAGYYRYSSGYLPEFPGISQFQGRVIHPQNWPEDLDYTGKRVIIIGSGATAVTLLPNIAHSAAHVTMLQRSPSYVVSIPSEDRVANRLRNLLPAIWAYRISRLKNIAFTMYVYQLAQRFPDYVKKQLLNSVTQAVGPNCDAAIHFNPRYNPWQQRLCLVPDGDMFKAIKEGRASVTTGTIRTFTNHGVILESGETLAADIVITATGLVMQPFGGVEFFVDGKQADISQTISYKGVMLSGIPNFAAVFGYINASWTLKADLICSYVCRLLNFMDKKGIRQVVPQAADDSPAAPFVENFTSGYVQRALQDWPKQGAKTPWRVHQNYLRDLVSLRWQPLKVGKPGLMVTQSPKTAGKVSESRF